MAFFMSQMTEIFLISTNDAVKKANATSLIYDLILVESKSSFDTIFEEKLERQSVESSMLILDVMLKLYIASFWRDVQKC